MNNAPGNGPDFKPDNILQHFTKNIGLLEKVFGKSNDVMYDSEYERIKTRLKIVYKKQDVDEIFSSRIDEVKVRSFLDILFRVPQFPGQDDGEKRKFLGIF